ncbi:MAG: hypothetical protein IIC73_03695, partial [Armatimonadetes bacterium]|nr:hypothetical protein [Armatimonadota bacterium]
SPLSGYGLLLSGALGLGAALANAQAGLGLPKWVQQQIFDRITVSGYRRVSYHRHVVTGDDEAFGLGNYGGSGNKDFTDFGNVRVVGRQVAGAMNFDLNFQDSRFRDPQAQRFSLDYGIGPWQADLGDIQGRSLNTNRFAMFNKSLRGVSLGYTGGPFQAKALFSEVRGAPRTVTLNGTNSAGPYFLQSAQIVRGSETVEIDGVRQSLQQDYTINYEIGAITFVNRRTLEAKIIPPTSTIVATYEVFGFSGSRGRVQAVGLSYNFGKYGRLGLTSMGQIMGGSGRLSSRLEKFQGFGPPSTPYFLQFEPLATDPVAIRVDGVLQTEGVDFFFDLDNPSIFFFNRFMAATSNIDVLYTPKPTRTVDGDRQTLGWDVRIPLGTSGQNGMVRYSEATGRLTNTPTPSSGTARGIDLRYSSGPTEILAGLRDVPSGYVNVETVGFSRNERAMDLKLNVRPSVWFNYGLGYSNASISSRRIDTSGNPFFVSTRFTSLQGSASFRPQGDGLPWTVSHSRVRSRNPQGSTRVDTTDVSTSRAGKNWDARLSLEHQDASGPLTGSAGTERRSVSLDSIALRTAYRPSKVWSFNINTSLSQVRSGGESGLGRDIQAALQWRPSDRLNANLDVQDSDAGKLATLGQFNTGYGSGFDGNGFSGGAGSTGLISASKVRSYRLRASYSSSDALTFGARAYLRQTSGSFSSNTETTGFGFDADWLINPYTSIQTSIDTSRTQFLGSPLHTANTVISAFLDGNPAGPWSWHTGLSTLLSGGSGVFGQDSTTIDTSIGFRIGDRQSLSLLVYSSTSTGAISQDDLDISLNYQYRIWRSMALQLAYRARTVTNRDPLLSSGAYTSRGFDIELVFNFGS